MEQKTGLSPRSAPVFAITSSAVLSGDSTTLVNGGTSIAQLVSGNSLSFSADELLNHGGGGHGGWGFGHA